MSVLPFLVIVKFSRFLYKDKSQYTFIKNISAESTLSTIQK